MTTETSQKNDGDSGATDQPQTGDVQRKAYARPKLTVYGNVRDFTRGGGGTKADKGGFFK